MKEYGNISFNEQRKLDYMSDIFYLCCIIISSPWLSHVLHLQRRYVILPKTLAPSRSRSALQRREAKKKEHSGQKEGRSAGDSCQSFRRFSRRILSATPGARIRIRTESQRDRDPADFEYAGALGNAKFCCSGSSHCSVLCNYTMYNPPPLYSFFESVTLPPSSPPPLPPPSPPRTFLFLGDGSCCSTCLSPCRGAKVVLEKPSSGALFLPSHLFLIFVWSLRHNEGTSWLLFDD